MEVTDWLYSPERMELREQCLSALLRAYGRPLNPDGTPVNSTESIFSCAHDWVSQGNDTPDGITNFYEEHYRG